MMAKAYAILVFVLIFLLAPKVQAGFYNRKAKAMDANTAAINEPGTFELRDITAKLSIAERVRTFLSFKKQYAYPYKKKSKLAKNAITLEGVGLAIGYLGLIAGKISGSLTTYIIGVGLGAAFFLAGMVCNIVAMAKKEKKVLHGILTILFGILFFIPLFLGVLL